MDTLIDECHLFSILKTPLRQDLTTWHGFSNPSAGAILNWFDPANPEYLEHVDTWQEWLCSGALLRDPGPFEFKHRNAFGSWDLFSASVDEVRSTHQIAKLLYKYHGTPRRETNMEEVKTRLSQPLPIRLATFELDGIAQCLSSIEPPDLNECIGRFGPGCTAEGFDAYKKWHRVGVIPDVPPNLYRVNPRDPWSPRGVEPYGMTKIAEVPKSIKTNRIVSSEPAMHMYAQLAVMDHLYKEIRRCFPGHASLANQARHNRFLLCRGACSIDLKDASDHVQIDFVDRVLPQLRTVLSAVRSTHAQFPDGDIIELKTFAPMGSGVCFPVLTLCALGICAYAAKLYKAEHPGCRVWYTVYGDDIIVCIELYDIVMDLIARSGLLPNYAKSCCTMIYRESCGREMFHSWDITPGYIRDPLDRLYASKVEELLAVFDERLFPATAQVVADLSAAARQCRYNSDLQRLEVSVRTASAREKVRTLDEWDGLNRWFSVHTQREKCGPEPSAVTTEVWTKPAWRFKASQDYPHLTRWLVTSHV